jgi:hypothetical protein
MEKSTSKPRLWSAEVAKRSNALDLEPDVFTWKDPRKIAESLKRSTEESMRRKGTPLQSAMSMLNFTSTALESTSTPLRETSSSTRRTSFGNSLAVAEERRVRKDNPLNEHPPTRNRAMMAPRALCPTSALIFLESTFRYKVDL